jgi:hypothetical protein
MVEVASTLRSLGDHLQVGASVRNVYGDPVNVGGRTVIPIARVSYGFGAGGGVGASKEAEPERGGSGGRPEAIGRRTRSATAFPRPRSNPASALADIRRIPAVCRPGSRL